VHGSSNLFVLSTAVFPTAGTLNPSFSMLCLGGALAESIAGQLRRARTT
jgi:choline dehydrogenase-like flavoprotein